MILLAEDRALVKRAIAVFIRWRKAEKRLRKKKGKPESWGLKRDKIRFAVRVFIEAWKAGQLRLLFNVIITGMELKLSWEEQMGRLTGEDYAKQIKNAVEEYKAKYPENFQTKIKIDGYEKWKREVRNEP